jgi:hypothetical protein
MKCIEFMYSETSLNRTLRKPVLPEHRLIFSVPAEQFFAKEVSQNRPYFLVPVLAGLEKFHCKCIIYKFKIYVP